MDRFQFQKVAGWLGVTLLLAACNGDGDERGARLKHDGKFYVGVAAQEITPLVVEGYVDEYEDENKNGQRDPFEEPNNHYDPGEKQLDENGNGIWEPAWIAGFSPGRAAQGVHDPLWARTIAMQRDGRVLTFTVLDLVGMLPTRMVEIRRRVKQEVGEAYDLQDAEIVIASTHTHESPDTMGIWGEAIFKTGINEEYMQYIVKQAARSIVTALQVMQPAKVKFAYARANTDINDDSRFPFVIDDDIYAAQFIGNDGKTIASLLEYSMHPEVLWSQNTQITSDFPHYVRQRLEAKLGGTAVFATGMVGGLMTPKSDTHTFEQAEYVGNSLADSALAALEESPTLENCNLQVAAQKIRFAVDNPAFRVMIENEILDASKDDLLRDSPECATNGCVEVYAVAANVCDVAQFATVPGELFPELGMGGFDQPLEWDGDYATAPTGTPLKESLEFPDAPTEMALRRDLMSAEFRFVFGLANGELGYIVPKSQWDPEDYEETVSLGAETAPRLLAALEEIFAKLVK